jgi:hypothetical protein
MQKLIRNGCVGIIYSPGHGAGWYSGNIDQPEILFDPALIDFIEKQEWAKFREYMVLKYPSVYVSERNLDLEIEWLPEGTEFRVEEYDGAEGIVLKHQVNWLVA